jgi:hypothetical protein
MLPLMRSAISESVGTAAESTSAVTWLGQPALCSASSATAEQI